MITIPRLSGQQVQPQVASGGGLDVNVPNAGAALGAGVAAVGIALEHNEQKASETAAMNGETEFRRAIGNVTVGTPDEPGYLYTQGAEAVARAPSAMIRLQQIGDDIAGRMTDDNAREAFTRLRDQLLIQTAEKINSHALEQDDIFQRNSTGASVDAAIQTAVGDVLTGRVKFGSQTPSLPASAGEAEAGPSGTQGSMIRNERALQESLAAALTAFHAYVGRNAAIYGASAPDVMAHGEQQIRSRFWAATIKAALTPGPNQDDRLAKALLDAHGVEIETFVTPGRNGAPDVTVTRQDVQGDVDRAYVVGQSQRIASTALASAIGETWSQKRDDAISKIPKNTPDDERAGAAKLLATWTDAGRTEQTKGESDTLSRYKDLVDANADKRTVTGFSGLDLLKSMGAGMSSEGREAAAKYWNDTIRGTHSPTDPVAYDLLNTMMLADPHKFAHEADIDLAAMQGKLNPEDAKAFREARDAILKSEDAADSKAEDSFLTPARQVQAKAEALYPKDKANQYEFLKQVQSSQRAWQQAKPDGKLTPAEFTKMLDVETADAALRAPDPTMTAIVKMMGRGPQWDPAQPEVFSNTTVNALRDIPPGDLRQILTAWTGSGKRLEDLTPDLLAQAWLKMRRDEP